MGRIWLIGGTSESALLAKAIAHLQIQCIVSVTTEAARSLYPNVSILQVWVGRLTLANLDEFLYQQQITAVLDASHPYAVEISKNAIAVCQKLQIPYLRYERQNLTPPTAPMWVNEEELGSQRRGRVPQLEATGVVRSFKDEQSDKLNLTYLDNFYTLISGNYLNKQRVLLTIGYRPLHLFQSWQERATLFARLLPSIEALQAALNAGFTPDRMICLRPPVSADLEKALWHQWKISLVVTKASGQAGGEDVKRKVAAELGVPLVVITRPEITYPQQTSDISQALEFCVTCA